MKSWMKILLSVFCLLSLSAHSGCRISDEVKAVYSLSGPFTNLLEETGLLFNPKVKGVSLFYPVPDKFQGEKIPGGVFLSPGKLNQMKNALVVFDESQELRKLFHRQNIRTLEVKSRGKTPSEVVSETFTVADSVFVDCGDALKKMSKDASALEAEIKKRMPEKMKIIFFLGEINSGKLPELIMANDGIVLWLRQMNLIETYPSVLAYVPWSSSILNSLEKSHLFLGMKDSGPEGVSGKGQRLTLTHRGILTPGLMQLKAWKYFLDHSLRAKL